jgi:hypothetical protein
MPKPGQLWMWKFTIGDVNIAGNQGWWPFRIVERGFSFNIISLVFGDAFLVVSINGAGPQDTQVPTADYGNPPYVPKVWHVGLRKGKLFWINGDELTIAELVCDAV